MRLIRLAALPAEAARERLARERVRIDNMSGIVAAHAPDRLLKLGFALLRSGDRTLVSARDARRGDEVEIRLADGTLTATVNRIEIWQKKS